ncbi:MAG TPA: hypothetical protein PK661_10500, partial [Syntrophorhabdaceae bacterium]|nr:hypothetical protein [Syntrophorhabdaceae bacterium]
MDEETKKRTQETAKKLFGKGIKMDPPYMMWKEFDRDLANDLSMFITGNLYSRTVLTLPERQMVACAMLAALGAADELRLHVNAALNVVRKWTFSIPTKGERAGQPYWSGILPVSFRMWGGSRPPDEEEGQWQAYFPGPCTPIPWRVLEQDDGKDRCDGDAAPDGV